LTHFQKFGPLSENSSPLLVSNAVYGLDFTAFLVFFIEGTTLLFRQA